MQDLMDKGPCQLSWFGWPSRRSPQKRSFSKPTSYSHLCICLFVSIEAGSGPHLHIYCEFFLARTSRVHGLLQQLLTVFIMPCHTQCMLAELSRPQSLRATQCGYSSINYSPRINSSYVLYLQSSQSGHRLERENFAAGKFCGNPVIRLRTSKA